MKIDVPVDVSVAVDDDVDTNPSCHNHNGSFWKLIPVSIS